MTIEVSNDFFDFSCDITSPDFHFRNNIKWPPITIIFVLRITLELVLYLQTSLVFRIDALSDELSFFDKMPVFGKFFQSFKQIQNVLNKNFFYIFLMLFSNAVELFTYTFCQISLSDLYSQTGFLLMFRFIPLFLFSVHFSRGLILLRYIGEKLLNDHSRNFFDRFDVIFTFSSLICVFASVAVKTIIFIPVGLLFFVIKAIFAICLTLLGRISYFSITKNHTFWEVTALTVFDIFWYIIPQKNGFSNYPNLVFMNSFVSNICSWAIIDVSFSHFTEDSYICSFTSLFSKKDFENVSSVTTYIYFFLTCFTFLLTTILAITISISGVKILNISENQNIAKKAVNDQSQINPDDQNSLNLAISHRPANEIELVEEPENSKKKEISQKDFRERPGTVDYIIPCETPPLKPIDLPHIQNHQIYEFEQQAPTPSNDKQGKN